MQLAAFKALQASLNGTTIPSASSIADSSLNTWTVSSGVVYKNGMAAGYTANVTLLLYYNGTIYQKNNVGSWWSWNGSTWVTVSSDPRGPASISGTTIPSVTQIVDSAMNIWAVNGGVIYENGSASVGTANVILLLYFSGTVYQENSASNWSSWNGSTWTAVSGDPRVSASGTTIPSASQIIDSAHNVWTVSGNVVYENGTVAGYSANVTLLLYYNGIIYQENSAGSWWSWNGNAWVAESGDPRVSGGGSPSAGVKVVGNTITTLTGTPLVLQGTNISGLEGYPGQNNSWMDGFGATTVAQWTNIKMAWQMNVIRLPLNEYEWRQNTMSTLGTPYRTIVATTVANITAAGMYVILDLHWGAPNVYNGSLTGNSSPGFADGQPGYMNSDNSTNFWSSVATTFKANPAVIFELFNEPYAAYWGVVHTWSPAELQMLKDNSALNTYTFYMEAAGSGVATNTNLTFTPAGHQQLLNAIRATGATNVILWSTTQLDNYPADSLAVRPTDSLGTSQIAATVHYAGGTASDYTTILSAGYPIVMTEMTNLNFIGGYSFAQSNKIGYLMWGPNNWGGAPDLSLLITQPPWSTAWSAGVSGMIPWPPF